MEVFMDYQKLISSLLAEAKKGIRYKQFNIVMRIIAIICMAPFYVFAFFGVVYYYVSLFLYNALLSPCTYLEAWEKDRTKDMHPAPKAVVLFCTTTFIFFLRILIAFFSFFFYFQWFSLQITLYICTLGGIKFQPWINTATFDEEITWTLRPEKKTAQTFLIPTIICEFAPFFFLILFAIFEAIAEGGNAVKFCLSMMDICAVLAYVSLITYLVFACIVLPCVYRKQPAAVETTPTTEEITE